MGLFSGKRKAQRRAARLERIKARQSGKSARAAEKADAKEAAYNAGIDPNAFLSDIVDDVANTAQQVLGKGAKGGPPIPTKNLDQGGAGGGAGMGGSLAGIPLPLIAVAAFLLLKK